MKAFGKLPSSPDIQALNDAQWLYCYLNILEDEKNEEELQKIRIKYQALFYNAEAVKQMEEFERNGGKKVPEKSKANTTGDVYVNDDFEKEIAKAMNNSEMFEFPDENTVRGNPDMSSDEFISQCMDDFSRILDEEDLDVIEIDE